MCGRYGRSKEEYKPEVAWAQQLDSLHTFGYRYITYNAAPKQVQPVITLTKPHELQLFLWGLIPHNSDTDQPKYPFFNARAETLDQIYPWKSIFPKQRCLVPASFFYEWPKVNGKAVVGQLPYLFKLKSDESFSFAGLWDAWKSPETGLFKPSFTIITTVANDLLKPYHDRMPVMLTGSSEEVWMDPSVSASALGSVLQPYPPEEMMAYAVSPLVGNARNNEVSLTKPMAWKS